MPYQISKTPTRSLRIFMPLGLSLALLAHQPMACAGAGLQQFLPLVRGTACVLLTYALGFALAVLLLRACTPRHWWNQIGLANLLALAGLTGLMGYSLSMLVEAGHQPVSSSQPQGLETTALAAPAASNEASATQPTSIKAIAVAQDFGTQHDGHGLRPVSLPSSSARVSADDHTAASGATRVKPGASNALAAPQGNYCAVTALNVRQGPGVQFAQLDIPNTRLTEGEMVRFERQGRGGWWQIRTREGRRGWVSSLWLRRQDESLCGGMAQGAVAPAID